ncbi:MAG TPA: family 78 glycoside hydrolase catalytic domain [Bacteroidota bacterium]|nr:family 78 glycoside hydrolase catalytic domain [Bacteroidota bacterium]
MNLFCLLDSMKPSGGLSAAAVVIGIIVCMLPLLSVVASSATGSGNATNDAQWIIPFGADQNTPATPCPLLRTSFRLAGKPASASVRVIGLGHFELTVNGQRVGPSLINQPWSQYNKTIYWQEFAIVPYLTPGENVIGVQLGNSFWYVGAANDTGRYVKTDAMPNFAGSTPYLLWLEARMTLADGQVQMVTSNETWKWLEGPLTFSHIYAGEDYDARRVQPGWNRPGFNDKGWKPVTRVQPPSATLERYAAPPLKAFEVFSPTAIKHPRPGEYTYVFSQNCSALLRFTVEGTAGQTIRFKPCEYMDSTGQVRFTYTWGTKKDIWHDYTLRGGGAESHQVLFCYVGAQYVGVTGAVPEGQPNPEGLPVIRKLDLVHVRAANAVIGSFMSSDQMHNGAHQIIDWAIRSNMSYVATDCPHREKNGWQEENWHMARAISYRFDVRSWYAKIARDLLDTQLPDGHIPTNCPNYLVGVEPHGYWNEAPEWGISGVLVPWHVYEWYGDSSLLKSNFESMKKYIDYLSSQAKDGIITSNLGDWYDYGHGKGDGPSQWTPNEVSATAIWALGAKTVSAAATVLKKNGDAARYQKLFERIRADFQRHFYNDTTKTVRNNGSCQSAHSVALQVGLIPEQDRAAVLQGIVDDLERRNWQQTVGEVLQVFFVRALAEEGRNDVLHRVYAREERGGYGYMVKQGFTTLPESWDARPGTGNSMNHYMLGHLMEWQFAYVGGIRQQPGSIGWRKVYVAPDPGNLDFAMATFDSPRGLVAVTWRKKQDQIEMTITSPRGMWVDAIMPNGEKHHVAPGRQILRAKLK